MATSRKTHPNSSIFLAPARLLLLLFVSLPFLCAGCSSSGQTYSIGVLLPLSGSEEEYGKTLLRSVQFACEELMALKPGFSVRLVTEDSAVGSDELLTATQRLIEEEKVCAVIGPVTSPSALVVAGLCQAANIPMITPTATHRAVTRQGDCIFSMLPNDELQSQFISVYLAREMGLKRIAVLMEPNEYSSDLGELVMTNFEGLGAMVVYEGKIDPSNDFYYQQLSEAKKRKAQAIVAPIYPQTVNKLVANASAMGLELPIFASDALSAQASEYAQKFAPRGQQIFYSVPTITRDSERQRRFSEKYVREFKKQPDLFQYCAYDAAGVLFDALQRVFQSGGFDNSGLDKEALKESLASTNEFKGAMGPIVFNPARGRDTTMDIGLISNGKNRNIGTFAVRLGRLEKIE